MSVKRFLFKIKLSKYFKKSQNMVNNFKSGMTVKDWGENTRSGKTPPANYFTVVVPAVLIVNNYYFL